MESKLKHENVLPRIRKINKALFDKGYNLRDVDGFWLACIRDAKKQEVMAMFYDGLSDKEIAAETGYGAVYISQITTKGLSEKMHDKS